jgi:hypothetical protein
VVAEEEIWDGHLVPLRSLEMMDREDGCHRQTGMVMAAAADGSQDGVMIEDSDISCITCIVTCVYLDWR